ncbi:MAG: hypothetical protein EZS28_017317 [Streblomastix strix]|uniref:Uncharacterized protein n=1 Tax=Streblomastix strix TaxID=222440 RepID=A0A5J4VY85_9EUKA|nr:MAG: hypothetical protein EZS28_017317 [Streblomastix strix]
MSRRPRSDRILAVELYYQFQDPNLARRNWPDPNAPEYRFIERWAQHFEPHGNVNDSHRSGRPASTLTPENIELMLEDFEEKPEIGYHVRQKELNFLRSIIQRFAHSLHFKSFVLHRVKAFSKGNYLVRLDFCRNMIRRYD